MEYLSKEKYRVETSLNLWLAKTSDFIWGGKVRRFSIFNVKIPHFTIFYISPLFEPLSHC